MRSGFTVLEILITMGILLLISGLGWFVTLDFYRSNVLDAERDIVVGVLRRARSRALSNALGSAHGVFVDTGNYVIFAGPSYASRNTTYDETMPRSAAVTVTGLTETVFMPLTATSTASGTIALSDGARTSTIGVNYEGRITW